jgi:hypothetical protein
MSFQNKSVGHSSRGTSHGLHLRTLHWTTKFNIFFGTRGKISNPNITFNAEFKYVSSFSPSPTVFCDSQVKCERNVYIYILHTIT